jgi:hypothetical protein
MFASASWELSGCGNQKLKQTTSFRGELLGCRKATEASLEWEVEKEEKQSVRSFSPKFTKKVI